MTDNGVFDPLREIAKMKASCESIGDITRGKLTQKVDTLLWGEVKKLRSSLTHLEQDLKVDA